METATIDNIEYGEVEISYKEHTIKIEHDYDAQSPRDWGNLGTMACFHSLYNLGDSHDQTIEELQELINQKDIISLPLYLYDHSGITISTSNFNDRFDSGQVGYIYVSKQKIREEFSVKRISEKMLEKIYLHLKVEVETYDQFLTGEVYGYTVENENEDHIASCWGFYGDEGREEAVNDAKNAIDYEEESLLKNHIKKNQSLDEK